MEDVVELLGALARRLVPGCDPEVVRRVFQTASVGYAGPRTREGRRASPLTPTGVPFELNLSVGDERPEAALRYVTETASGQPFFRPRLDAQRAALDQLVRWLPGDHRPVADEVQAFVDLLFPDPAAVPARTRFATFVGVVHEPEVPDGPAWLKVYGSLDGEGSLDRVAARWPAFGELREVVEPPATSATAEVDDSTPVNRAVAVLEVAASGARRHKVYCRPRADRRAAVDGLAARCGTAVDTTVGCLEEVGATVGRWHKVLVGCEARDGQRPALTLYFPRSALGCDQRGVGDLARRLARRHLPSVEWPDHLDPADDSSPQRWRHSGLGVGVRADGSIGKLNAYVVATDATGVLTG